MSCTHTQHNILTPSKGRCPASQRNCLLPHTFSGAACVASGGTGWAKHSQTPQDPLRGKEGDWSQLPGQGWARGRRSLATSDADGGNTALRECALINNTEAPRLRDTPHSSPVCASETLNDVATPSRCEGHAHWLPYNTASTRMPPPSRVPAHEHETLHTGLARCMPMTVTSLCVHGVATDDEDEDFRFPPLFITWNHFNSYLITRGGFY